jgi:hypothetical protein
MWRERGWWSALVVVLYVAAAALKDDPSARGRWLGAALAVLMLAIGWRLSATPDTGVDRVEPTARRATRAAVLGASLVVVAAFAPASVGFSFAQRLGVGLAGVGSLVALVRVGSLGGVAALRRRPTDEAAIAAGLMWAIALGLLLRPLLAGAVVDPSTTDYTAVAASLGSVAITVVAAYRLYARRRFELGVAERAAAALWLSVLTMVIAVFAALMAVAKPERVVPHAALVSALVVCVASLAQRPTTVSRALRTAAAVTLLCAPLASVAVVVAYKAPTHAGLVLFVSTIAAAGLGLLAPRLAQRLAPERGLWLRVLDDAIEAAKEPDPQQAVVEVLTAIRDGLGEPGARAALYRFASEDRVTIDRAGYMHTAKESAPTTLLDHVAEEPERVLSTESLRSAQVVRPEVRDLVAWLDRREIGMVALVFDEEVCVGMLAWPAAGRRAPLSHQEVVLAHRLAAHLGAVTGAAAQLARSRARELEAEQAMQVAEVRVQELLAVIRRQGRRQRALAQIMSQPARIACYSPAAQAALLHAERLGRDAEPLAMVAPAGVDPLCWAAIVHLVSERRESTLLVVDGTAPDEQAIAHWQDPETSPLAVAQDGTLVLLDAPTLPAEVQRYVARTLPPATGLIVVSGEPLLEGLLEENLLAAIGERVVMLPTLAERAEDLRALALYKLARIGLRLRGKEYGLSLDGQAQLNEHPWPGNDAEFDAVLLRAALATRRDVVDGDTLRRVLGDDTLAQSGPHDRADYDDKRASS